jgi:transglutaminase-like putative cysteine protease
MGLIAEMREARFWDDWEEKFEENRYKYITPQHPAVIRAANRANVRGGTDKEKAKSAWWRVYKQVKYTLSKEWKTPDQTLRERAGDCEDVSFLIASMLPNMGVTGHELVIGDLIFPDGKRELHVWVDVDGLAVDPTGSPKLSGKVTYEPVKRYVID